MGADAQARSFAVAFASFGIFAVAYTQLADVIRLSPDFNIPASMNDTIEVLVLLFFVASNMIMLLRSLAIRHLDANRSIILALMFMATALLLMFAAKVIDSRYVLEFSLVDGATEREMVLIRPVTLSATAREMLLVDGGASANFIENRRILQDLRDNLANDPERFDVIIVDNGVVAFTYALFIALSKGMLLFSLSLLTWASVMLTQGQRRAGAEDDASAQPTDASAAMPGEAAGLAGQSPKLLAKAAPPRRRVTMAKSPRG